MDIDFTPDERRFRQDVRDWLAANAPGAPRPTDGPDMRAFDLAWQRKQYEGGWAGISWPKEYGGCGLSLIQQLIWFEECGRRGVPPLGSLSVALNHAGPTLIALGTDEQKRFHLPRILRGEAVWCQGFSEPGAGSDLAGVRTRGVVEGDHLTVTGQKIWTSHAHLAQFQELLVRTDPAAGRHHGLTWIICDMSTPGITVRPIKTMVGSHHYCEVFYDAVRIPLSNVVGQVNGGWQVAMSTLSFERGPGLITSQMALARQMDDLIALAGATPDVLGERMVIEDEAIMSALAALNAEVAALRAMTYVAVSRGLRQGIPGAESSLVALYFAELAQRVQQMAIEVLGPAMLERTAPNETWVAEYLRAFMDTIAGGTSEIRRNIIAERLLGLPR
ncbi:MAG: acyl-CoA dehydrogenase [Phenylobacterium sp.]|nr:acyl-CoA dehydrogenase [Phenylobacterium sp.]